MNTYVITGAGSGIGQAVADRLHARGDMLYLPARTPESAERIAARLPQARPFVADLADPAGLASAVAAADAAVGLPERINGLLHIAGVL